MGNNVSVKRNRTKIILIVTFIILLILGVFLLLKNLGVFNIGSNQIRCSATITKVYKQNSIDFEYIFNGEIRQGHADEYIIGYAAGKVITIIIDSKTGAFISTVGGSVITWIASIFCLSVGGIGLFFTILNTFRDKKHAKEVAVTKGDNNVNSLDDFESKLLNKQSEKVEIENKVKSKYLFRQTKSSVFNYELLDKENKRVYYCQKGKYTFLKGVKVNFINEINNKTTPHQISMTSSSSSGVANIDNAYLSTSFRMDGIDAWKLISEMKIKLQGNPYEGSVIVDNANIGTFKKLKLTKSNWLGRRKPDIEVECNDEYLDQMFIVLFTITYPVVSM